jgi:hypothetical protein
MGLSRSGPGLQKLFQFRRSEPSIRWLARSLRSFTHDHVATLDSISDRTARSTN